MIGLGIKTYPDKKTDPRVLQHTEAGHYHTAKHNHWLDFFLTLPSEGKGEH